jgi:hypothetical protein
MPKFISNSKLPSSFNTETGKPFQPPKPPSPPKPSLGGRIVEFFNRVCEKWSSGHKLKDLASSVSAFTSKISFQNPLKSSKQAEKPEGKSPLAGRVTVGLPSPKNEEEGVEMAAIDPNTIKKAAEKAAEKKKVDGAVQGVMDSLHPEGLIGKSPDIPMPRAESDERSLRIRGVRGNEIDLREEVTLPDMFSSRPEDPGLFASLTEEEEAALDTLKQEFSSIQTELVQIAEQQIKSSAKDKGALTDRADQLRDRQAKIKDQIWGVSEKTPPEPPLERLDALYEKLDAVEKQQKALPDLSPDAIRDFDEQIQEIKDSSEGNKERKIVRVEERFGATMKQVEKIKALKAESSSLYQEIAGFFIEGIETVDGEDPNVVDV